MGVDLPPARASGRLPWALVSVLSAGVLAGGIWSYRLALAALPIDASLIPLAVKASFGLAFAGVVLALLLGWRGVQARSRAALLKAESERQALIRHFDYLSKYANDTILLMDDSGRIVEANDAAAAAYGHGRGGLPGRSLGDLVAPAKRELFNGALQALRLGESLRLESEHLRANGEAFPVEVCVRLIESGGATYMQAIVDDIGDRKRSERKLRQILDVSPAAVYSMPLPPGSAPESPNRQGFISESIGRLSGFSVQEWRADPALWRRRLHPDDRDRVCAGLPEVLEKGALTLEYRFLHRDGHYFWVRDSHVVVTGDNGEPAEVVGAWMDVTGDKQTEGQLRLFAQVFEFSREAILITDADTRILSVNRSFTGITGYTPDEVLGGHPSMLSSGLQAAEFYRNMWRELVAAGHWQGEIWNRRKNGEYYPEWLSISDVRDETGRITHYVGIFSDISEFKAAQDKIEYLARHDPLTHLPNRCLLDDRFAQAVARAVRAGGKLGLLFLDLDRFKAINDSLGHEIGDRLLQGIAQRLLVCVRETDTVCRQGGDEFIIVLDEASGTDAVAGVANKILDALQRPFEIGSHSLVTSFSIGIAIYPDDGADIATLMKKADTAMYYAKESGRNTYRFHTEQMNFAASTRVKLESALRRALERGEFQLHYQPQIDLAGGRLVGAEALLRWKSPEMGWIPPGEFIPIAEDSGLIVPIGEWVLREACRQAVAWRAQGLSACSVAVNLSALQFKRGQVVEMVDAALRETGLEPACLELELTESLLLQDAAGVMESLRCLKGMGVKLSLDDFGTGYSSLSYLRRLEMDQLKIDQSFVRDLPHNAEGAALVRAIVQMAHALSLSTVAEGVETVEQLDYLRGEGCKAAQGFYLARPMPPAEFVQRYISGGGRTLG
ncbi:MAG TPA: EAL domain-containing protein [Methylococcaceae bacterium]|nr:EAL domain-containing protein [Methylococcaceae bacterium]